MTYSDFEIDHFLGKSAHFVVEAETVIADVVAGEDKVTLSLLGLGHDDLVAGAGDCEVDVKGPAGLDLDAQNSC